MTNSSLDLIPYLINEKTAKKNWLKKHITPLEDKIKESPSKFSKGVSTKMQHLAHIDSNRIKLINSLLDENNQKATLTNMLGLVANEKHSNICIEFNDRARLESEHPGLCIAFNRYRYRKGVFSQLIFDCQFWFIKCPFTIIHFFALQFKHIIDILCSMRDFQNIPQFKSVQININSIIQYYERNIFL